jgi:DNA-binding NtrC family response regulator
MAIYDRPANGGYKRAWFLHTRRPVAELFVGDRFVRSPQGSWLDIATGAPVEVQVRLLEEPWSSTAAPLDEELARVDRHRPALLDFGRIGRTHWFLARTIEPGTAGARPEHAVVGSTVDRIAEAAELTSGPGVRVLRALATGDSAAQAQSASARRLRDLGFVSISAQAVVPRWFSRLLVHRHVALFVDPGSESRATAWVRWLARVSARGHLVILWRRAPCLSQSTLVRAAERDQHVRDGEVFASAERLIGLGNLARAEAVLAAAAAEAALWQLPPPVAVSVGLVMLRFWQGRFAEAAVHLSAVSAGSVDVLAWNGLVAWAVGDAATLMASMAGLAKLAALGQARAGFWSAGLNLVGPGPNGGQERRAQVRAFLEKAHGWPAGLTGLGLALAGEALLAAGQPLRASRVIRRARAAALARGRLRALDAALLEWIGSKCEGREAGVSRQPAARFIARTGARGITRWGLGRPVMNVLHGLSDLLQLVQESDDEQMALRRGCSWVREHAGADAVGIVTDAGGAVVVSDGLARKDLDSPRLRHALGFEREQVVGESAEALVASPMRYGGVTIGFAVVKGHRDREAALAEAGAALASACAPALRARLDALAFAGAGQSLAPEILGASPAMAGLREAIARAAGTSFSVLVEGESGTGKELVARALHRLSARRDRRFSAINCAALTDELVEAELFGYVRGAFTGAIGNRTGLFEEAHMGTLFLDEVSELSPRGQAKLLRVLQEREIRRLGENAPRTIDVRVIAATNQPLAEAVGRGRFREDLMFRLAVVRIKCPSLRDRIEDVPVLVHAFWAKLSAETGKRAHLGSDAVGALCRHHWPGNVRELQNVVAALTVAAPTRGRVGERHVEQLLTERDVRADPPGQSLDGARQAFERRVVAAALARHGGKRTHAALELGISRQGLTKAIKRLGLGGVA